MRQAQRARAAGAIPPTRDEGPTVEAVATMEITRDAGSESQAERNADQAPLWMEGELYGDAWLQRMQAGYAEPGELAVLVTFLTDEMLRGACRAIEKALGLRHA